MRHPLALVALLAACRTPAPAPAPAEPVDTTWTSSADALEPVPRASRESHERQAAACATMRDAEAADALKVTSEGLALFATEQMGLSIVDVSEPDEPRLLAVSPFTGVPAGVFARDGVAVVVFSPWDRAPMTVVRAISLAPRTVGRPLGEVTLRGRPRDVWRVADSFVVTRELEDTTRVTAFVVDEHGLAQKDEIVLLGAGGVAAASPYGLAVARDAGIFERTAVTWISTMRGNGALEQHGTMVVSGTIPNWRHATDHSIDVTEDGRVRVVGCAASSCTPGDAAAYAAIDFAESDRPRLVASSLVARAADSAFGFDAHRMFVARSTPDGADASEIAVFRTEGELVTAGSVRLPGTVTMIDARGEDVVALGWTGRATTGRRAIVHHLDVHGRPRLVGSAAFGGDWTWSPAYDDERAMSFDPGGTLAAVPMTTMRARTGLTMAVQVISFGPRGPQPTSEQDMGFVERVLFVSGRLLAFSAEGVTVVASPTERSLKVTWPNAGAEPHR